MVTDRLRGFIVEKFPLARRHDFRDDTLLLEKGILDSLGILDIVTFIENEFQIMIEDEDLVPENFQSVSSLAEFLNSKLGHSDLAST